MDTVDGAGQDARMRRSPLALLLLVPLALPAAAGARTITADNVTSFGSFGVNCHVRQVDAGLECSSRAIPAPNGTDGYLELKRTGKARRKERGDFDGYDTSRRRLREGDTWRPRHTATGIVCRRRTFDIRCVNTAGHGFTISPKKYFRF